MRIVRRLGADIIMMTGALSVLLITSALLIGVVGSAAAASAAPEVIATTDLGRVISATRYGPESAEVRVVVIGQMHGNEPAGRRVIKLLTERLAGGFVLPANTALWLISTINPDGAAAGTRVTPSGVDLNRNFSQGWRQQGRGTSSWSGPSAGSELETEAMMVFLERVEPTAVLSFHQPFAAVDVTHPASGPAGQALASWLGLPAREVGCPGPCHGTLTGWVADRFSAVALTVEMPKRVTGARVERSATAVLRLTEWLAR